MWYASYFLGTGESFLVAWKTIWNSENSISAKSKEIPVLKSNQLSGFKSSEVLAEHPKTVTNNF